MPKRKTAKKRAVKQSKNRLYIPFPLVIFLLLCAGVFLLNSTFRASAQDIKITASIQGPPVTTPATITSPANGTHFSGVPIVVQGNCTANAAYIEIFRNNIMSGSAICSGAGTFEIQVDLFTGKNDITAHSFNINDNEGPVSSVVTVYYDVPQPPATTPEPSTPQTGSTESSAPQKPAQQAANPLILKTVFVYKGYYVDQNVEWPLEISGGNEPYAFNIDWGDGSNSVISRKGDGAFNINHKYKQPGPDKGAYTIKVQASDTDGNYAYLEFFVLVNLKSSDAFSAGNIYTKSPPALHNLNQWLWVAWPVYGSIFLMAISFKLGELAELKILGHNHFLKHTH